MSKSPFICPLNASSCCKSSCYGTYLTGCRWCCGAGGGAYSLAHSTPICRTIVLVLWKLVRRVFDSNPSANEIKESICRIGGMKGLMGGSVRLVVRKGELAHSLSVSSTADSPLLSPYPHATIHQKNDPVSFCAPPCSPIYQRDAADMARWRGAKRARSTQAVRCFGESERAQKPVL